MCKSEIANRDDSAPSQIEGGKHQDDADVDHQSFPESISEEQQIDTDNNGYQHHNIKHEKHVPCHFNHQLE